MNAEATVAWERFARMRLEGRSDLIYRAYDLLTPLRMHSELPQLFKIAGVQHAQDESEYNTLMRLQRQFMNWGFGIQSIDYIKILLTEYQSYRRCLDKNRAARWPYRPNDEVQRLYDENLKAIRESQDV